DHRVGPKPRTVLAHAPPLVLVTAVALRHLQLPAGLALRRFFGRIERGEVRTEDLVGAVAFDALGAGIPARDAPVRVEHEDGVVSNALDQQAEAVHASAGGGDGRPFALRLHHQKFGWAYIPGKPLATTRASRRRNTGRPRGD